MKNVVFSARQNHDIIQGVVNYLSQNPEVNLHIHDPTKNFFYLPNIPKAIKQADSIIVKVRNDCSIDLLHYAKIHKIPTLHDVDTVLMCKNKIALDIALRKVFSDHSTELKNFSLPRSWNQNLRKNKKFREWARKKLPIVIKSHYQHDKYNRFNFLVRELKEINTFYEKYNDFLYYDVYIQKFIESDGIERKIYVIGDKVFGIKRENPIFIYMREKSDSIKVDLIERKTFEISDSIKKLAAILSRELNLKIFGFDLVKSTENQKYYFIDLNDFPGFRGIKNVEKTLTDYLVEYITSV